MRKRVKKLFSWFTAIFYLLRPSTRDVIRRIIKDILQSAGTAPREKIFVMMMGFSLSGKTWFVNHHPVLSRYFQVTTRDIHDLLNTRFPLLDDDKSVEGSGFWPRQFLTQIIRKRILKGACQKGIAIASDSGNHRASERWVRLRIAKRWGYRTIIVWIICDEKTLMERLESADRGLEAKGKAPTWVDLYQNIQKKGFEPPYFEETDDLIIFQSGWDDPSEISF